MAVQLESREHFPGVKMLHHNKDAVIAFSGEATLRNLPYLMEAGALFAERNLGWSETNARFMLTRGLKVDHLTMGLELNDQTIPFIMGDAHRARKIPSVLLFREEGSQPGEYLGFAAQRMHYFQTENPEPGRALGEEVPTLYQILRAVEPGGRNQNRARSSIELALFLHADARWFFHRTANYIAAYTNTRSDSLNQEESYPWRHSFSSNPFAAELIRKGAALVRMNGGELDDNGVSRTEYHEPNLGVEELRPGARPEIVAIHDRMTREFRMGPLDVMYPLFKVA